MRSIFPLPLIRKKRRQVAAFILIAWLVVCAYVFRLTSETSFEDELIFTKDNSTSSASTVVTGKKQSSAPTVVTGIKHSSVTNVVTGIKHSSVTSVVTGIKHSSAPTVVTASKCSYNERFFEVSQSGWTKFPLLMPYVEPSISCEEREVFMVVVVNSDANTVEHRSRRAAIRNTWGKKTANIAKPFAWRLYFSLGTSYNFDSNRYNKHEARRFNDIIIGNFTETYKNLIIKTFMSHFWVFSRFSCKFVLKTDDDVYVRLPWLSNWLNTSSLQLPFYGGLIEYAAIVNRDKSSKWFITEEEFNGGVTWPPFAHGSFQVVSTDVLPEYFNYTQFRKPFHADDAFFGVAAHDLGFNVTAIPGFCFIGGRGFPPCELKTSTAICHDISPARMLSLYETYMTLKKQSPTYL